MRTIKGLVAIAVLSIVPVLANAAPKAIEPTAYQQSSVVQKETAPTPPLLPGSFEYQAGIGTGYQVAWVDHTRAAEPGDYNN